MRFNKPLTAGLILATLAAVAQGGVIQRPKEILSDLSQKDTSRSTLDYLNTHQSRSLIR